MQNTEKQMPPESLSSIEYRKIFAERTPEERHELAHIKRFMERLVADPVFRGKLDKNLENPKVVAEEYGIDIDPALMRPHWHVEYTKYRKSAEIDKWPLSKVWDDHLARMIAHRDLIRDLGACQETHPRFHAWRERQLARSASELGLSAGAIVHPVAAYELSEGCSVGCWFCGISADKFKGNWSYTPGNAELWRGILKVMLDLFGPAAQTGFCYWGTDPADNPDYPKFIEDHYQITGVLPQTTTAAPLKNIDLTRKVLSLQKSYPSIVNRFSIISLKILDKVHETFTPEELLEVELVTQNKESLMKKASAGRAAEKSAKMKAKGHNDKAPKLEENHTTIACVSGFLVSMMSRTVKLVSPTCASDKWPLGYRVYDEAHFDSPEEFRSAIEKMIDRFMPESIPANDRITFRDDLKFNKIENGFKLHGRGDTEVNCNLYPFSSRLGELIETGRYTAGDILGQLVSEGSNIFLVGDVLQKLFDSGVLNDDPRYGGIAGKREVQIAVQAV